MSAIENKDRIRREQDILDRLDEVKRLVMMENTLLTTKNAKPWCHFIRTDKDGHQIGGDLLSELRDEIQLQLLSIVALCYGDGPDCGEPCPILEWNPNIKGEENAEDRFRRVWEECLEWNV